MEPPEEIEILQMLPSLIGVIKESPVRRWMEGQQEWDRMYHQTAAKVPEQRQKCEQKAAEMLQDAREEGLKLSVEAEEALSRLPSASSNISDATVNSAVQIQEDRRWGPLDLDGERTPPSAICNRTDTVRGLLSPPLHTHDVPQPEAIALLKKSIFFTAPVTHRTIPRRKYGTKIRAALNPYDRVARAPKQSASEEQQSRRPMHGLAMWGGIIKYVIRSDGMLLLRLPQLLCEAELDGVGEEKKARVALCPRPHAEWIQDRTSVDREKPLIHCLLHLIDPLHSTVPYHIDQHTHVLPPWNHMFWAWNLRGKHVGVKEGRMPD